MKKIKWKIPILCVILGIAAAAVSAFAGQESRTPLGELLRPDSGEAEAKYRLKAVFDGCEEEVEVLVNERSLSFSEAQEIFELGREALLSVMERQNGSLEHIQGDIYLPQSILEGRIKLSWRSSDIKYIYDDGTINRAGCMQLPEEGVVVTMTAKMLVQDYEAETSVLVCLTEEDLWSEEERRKNILEQSLKKAEEVFVEEDFVRLPDTIDGKKVIYYGYRENNAPKLVMLGILAALSSIVLQRRHRQAKEEKRNKELALAYAPIVTKFTLLIGAGINIRGAWEKLADDYRKENTPNAAYEEIQRTCNEMQNGMPEGEAYRRFGKRCKLPQYIKFGNLLEQNLRKGTKGLTDMLESEVREAFEERKALAFRLGEEAGTKLLLPMLLLLAIVIAICVIPAFLSM